MHLKCKDYKKKGANSGSKNVRMAKLSQFLQGLPKPAFSEKVLRGDEGKFLKKIAQKVALVEKAQNQSGANFIIL